MSAYSIATRGLAGRKVPQGVLATMDDLLFAASEPGAWYDPSDMSTLFQDSAGTVPVTAVEQPVGRMLDKSGRGNHAIQATTTKRPILSRRVNLFLSSEDISAAYWSTRMNATTVPGIANPSGGITRKLIPNTGSTDVRWGVGAALTGRYALTVRAKADEHKWIKVVCGSGTISGAAWFNLETGLVGSILNTGAAATQALITPLSDGFYECSVIANQNVGGLFFVASSTGEGVVSGVDGVRGVHVWAMGLRGAADAHLPYQRVNTDTDYDADPAKFPAYLRWDGVDDALQTGNIDFTGTDKMTVWAGVTKLSNAGSGQIVQCGVNDSQPGFILSGPTSSPNPNFLSRSRGSVASFGAYTPNIYPAPISALLTMQSSVPDKVNTLRVNGASYFDTTDQGSGKYANAVIFIGASFGSASFFNGRIYGLIVRGAQSSLSQIEATEAYIKQKMRLP